MRLSRIQLLLLTVFIVGICHSTHAKPDNESSPARRINIAVADNKSVYTTVTEHNNYENLLRLYQPSGPYQLTAGMLNDGNNHIYFHRIDEHGIDSTFAYINLNANIVEPQPESISGITFNTNPPSSQTTITQDMLPNNWGTNGSNLIWQTNGYAYISGQGGLTFTVPEGYNNTIIQLVVYVGTNIRGGYFTTNYNSQGWKMAAQVTAGGGFIIQTFTGVNSGDVISIYGGILSDGSYYLNPSPDIRRIIAREVPSSFVPNVEVTPTISYFEGEDWGTETPMSNSVTYSPNDTINLYALGMVADQFSESTANNEQSAYYNYSVVYHANVALPMGDDTGLNFMASADFAAAGTSSPTSAAFTGPNNWAFNSTFVYNPSAGKCCYFRSYGSIIYTMPRSFMGNTVNVTMTSSTGDDGTGDMYVNGIKHTFSSGETYTWTIPVAANGVIEFKANAANSYSNTYSIDFTNIVISSGNGASIAMPVYRNTNECNDKTVKGLDDISLTPRPHAMSKQELNTTILVK